MAVTSQDVALASLVIAAIGIIVPWRTRVGDRTHAEGESGRIRKHERELAADERTYADRRDAYLDMVETVLRVQVFYNRMFPIGSTEPAPEPPSRPSEDALMRMDARMGVFGTDEVRTRLEAWDKARNAVHGHVIGMQSVEQRGQEPSPTQYTELEAARVEMQTKANEIDEAIRADMNRPYT